MSADNSIQTIRQITNFNCSKMKKRNLSAKKQEKEKYSIFGVKESKIKKLQSYREVSEGQNRNQN